MSELYCVGIRSGGGQLAEGDNQKNTIIREMKPANVTIRLRRHSDEPFVFNIFGSEEKNKKKYLLMKANNKKKCLKINAHTVNF